MQNTLSAKLVSRSHPQARNLQPDSARRIDSTDRSHRCVLIHTCEPVSGAARYVTELVTALAATGGLPVTLFCPSNFHYVEEVRSGGINVRAAVHRGIDPDNSFLGRIVRNLSFLVRTAWHQASAVRRKDIVHLQFPLYFPAGLVFFLLARIKGCSVVFTAHDPLPHKWLLPERLRRFEWRMLRWAYRLSDKIIVHNETGRQLLLREFLLPDRKIAVVPHGPLRFSQKIAFPPPGELRLLLFGGIREDKALHTAIEAVQAINLQGSKQVSLTIAGTVANAREEDYWARCKQLIARNRAGIRVEERYIQDDEIAPLFQEHHALLLPYAAFTSESGVASLALANRRPIIATNSGSAQSLFSQAPCGIPIDGTGAQAVAEAIILAREVGHDALCAMGAAGAALVDGTRSWDQIGRQTMAIYRAIAT